MRQLVVIQKTGRLRKPVALCLNLLRFGNETKLRKLERGRTNQNISQHIKHNKESNNIKLKVNGEKNTGKRERGREN